MIPMRYVVPKIGLEVHAQLRLNSKLFSQGGSSSHASPNTQLDLFDISLPGTLPKLNRDAVRAAILTSLGLNCTVQERVHFDRKNYFYTDMPAGFQITQYNNPIARGGYLDFIASTYHRSLISHSQNYDLVKYVYSSDRHEADEFKPYNKRSHIKQIQLEQDSAKSLHEISSSDSVHLVDYNRSGSALIEIVFEPDLSNHHEASSLVRRLITTLKALKTCDCELQEGSLRVDANVSIDSISGQKIENSGRVELKNLNSLKAMNKGILHEIERQSALILAGGNVLQESRTFDTKSARTVPLRVKEDSVDYRYVPEPNIPPLRLDDAMIEQLKRELPRNLPADEARSLSKEYGLDLVLVEELIERPGLSKYMRDVMRNRENYDANLVADYLIYLVANLERSVSSQTVPLNLDEDSEFVGRLGPEKIQILLDMIIKDKISFTTGYEVAKHIFFKDDKSSPIEIVNKFNWHQINDPNEIHEICVKACSGMKSISKNYAKKGNKKHLGLMVEKICGSYGKQISVKQVISAINEHLRHGQTKCD